VWAARRLDPARGALLAQLMAADGLDTGFGDVGEDAWRRFVRHTAAVAGIATGDSVFEVGCGAGAYLYELAAMGCMVGGLDASDALLGYARAALPEGRWSHGDASELDVTETWDAVVACGVFLYFPGLDYARDVLGRMARKARRCVMVLEVPDLARREATEARRRQRTGDAAYAAKYGGLTHLYMDKTWFETTLRALGFGRVRIEDQAIEGYENSASRYNVFAWAGDDATGPPR
jgi:ubiquinone/menaquinone biosynthesis C-methylase UbiE